MAHTSGNLFDQGIKLFLELRPEGVDSNILPHGRELAEAERPAHNQLVRFESGVRRRNGRCRERARGVSNIQGYCTLQFCFGHSEGETKWSPALFTSGGLVGRACDAGVVDCGVDAPPVSGDPLHAVTRAKLTSPTHTRVARPIPWNISALDTAAPFSHSEMPPTTAMRSQSFRSADTPLEANRLPLNGHRGFTAHLPSGGPLHSHPPFASPRRQTSRLPTAQRRIRRWD